MKLKKSTLILGIGNYLMGDEGIGVHVANVLEKYNPFDGVAILKNMSMLYWWMQPLMATFPARSVRSNPVLPKIFLRR